MTTDDKAAAMTIAALMTSYAKLRVEEHDAAIAALLPWAQAMNDTSSVAMVLRDREEALRALWVSRMESIPRVAEMFVTMVVADLLKPSPFTRTAEPPARKPTMRARVKSEVDQIIDDATKGAVVKLRVDSYPPVTIAADIVTIGSQSSCHVLVENADPLHAMIGRHGGRPWLTAMGETRLWPGGHPNEGHMVGGVAIHSGDIIVIGDTRIAVMDC